MRRTQLFIDNGSGYREVDLYDNIDIPITYNVADVRDISKKDSNFSLTVKLPNTNNNAQIFDVIHEIARYNSTFEMLKQYPAFIEVDCNRTFEGYFKLTKVIINDDKEVSYEGNLYSNVIEFMKRLGTTTLRGNADPADDLSFSEYTTTLVENDWLTRSDMLTWDGPLDDDNPPHPIGEKQYGEDWYMAPVDKYALNNRTSFLPHDIPMFFDEYTPFLFYKEIWDKLFEWAGFNYVSGFIDGTNNSTTFKFDHLVYPCLNTIMTLTDTYTKVIQYNNIGIANSIIQCYWQQNSSLPYPLDVCAGYVDCYSNPNNMLTIDEVGANTSSFSTYFLETINKGGVYSLNLDIPFDVWIHITDQSGNHDLTATDTVIVDDTVSYTVRVELVLRRGGSDTTLTQKIITDNYQSQYNAIGGVFQILNDSLTYSGNVYLEQGDELFFKYDYEFPCGGLKNTGGFINYTWVAHLQDPSPGIDGLRVGLRNYIQFLKSGQDAIQYDLEHISDFYPGGLFDPTVILDPNQKKVDFLTDVIRKFNLYIEDVTDKKDSNGVYYRDYPNIRHNEPILLIEPRNAYYSTNSIVRDWTQKTDVWSIEFQRIDDYIYNLLDFKDTNDKTYYTEDYEKYNYVEGEFGEFKITGQFNTSENEKTEVKTNLGQTMNINPTLYYNNIRQTPNLYLECPSIFKISDYGSYKEDVQWNPRMLFVSVVYAGSDPNNVYPWDFQDIYNASNINSWAIHYRNNQYPNEFVNGSFWKKYSTYNLLSHLNAPFGKDTADLNFGWANWYYQNFNGTWATANNCYNVFYKDMVDDYNSPDSRLMTCKMYLSPTDIRDLKLSDTIIVNNVAYHINKIKQWKNENEPVQVELIKIIQGSAKPTSGNKTNKLNSPPQLKSPIDVSALKNDVATLNKIIDSNTDELKNNTKLIASIKETLTKFEERLKKLESS